MDTLKLVAEICGYITAVLILLATLYKALKFFLNLRNKTSAIESRVLQTLYKFRVQDPIPYFPAKQLSSVLGVGADHVESALKELIKRGLVESQPHPHSTNENLIKITDAGAALLLKNSNINPPSPEFAPSKSP